MDREGLFEIIRTRSFRQGGQFTLASGRTSTIYFNLKPAMLHPEGARLIGAAIAEKASQLGAAWIGGLEMGAVPIVSAAVAMSAVASRPLQAFFIRKEAKGHGTRSLIEGLSGGESLSATPVVVVEDVTTTGASALKAIAAIRSDGGLVSDVITIVDREEGAADAFAAEGVTLHALFRKSEFAAEG